MVKIIEVVGSSTDSFSDAVRQAVRVAGQSVRNMRAVEVRSSSADIGDDGSISLYKVHCKIAFLVEESG